MLTLNGVPTEVYQDAVYKGDARVEGTLKAETITLVTWENEVVAWENDVISDMD